MQLALLLQSFHPNPLVCASEHPKMVLAYFPAFETGNQSSEKNLKTSERKELSTPDLLGHYFSVMYSCRWPVNVLPVIKARRENAH